MPRLLTTQTFADGLIVEGGTVLTEFDPSRPHRIDSGELRAVRDCADRLQRDTGRRPVVVLMGGKLRVFDRVCVAG